MRPSNESYDDARTLTNRTVFVVSLALILICLALIWVTKYFEGELAQSISVIATSLLPVGGISLIYDLFVRRHIAEELTRLVGIQKSVTRNNLTQVDSGDRINWDTSLRLSSDFQIILPNPYQWITSHTQSILHGSADRELHIECFFPDPEGSAINSIAEFFGENPEEFSATITRAADALEEAWKYKLGHQAIKTGSNIAIRYTNCIVTTTVVRADSKRFVLLHGLTKHRNTDHGFGLVFEGSSESPSIAWVTAQFEQVSDAPAVYQNNV